MAKIISKIISKTVLGFILGQGFGPIGFYIGWLIGDNIGEFGTEQIEKFFPELGKETGKTLVDYKDTIKDSIKNKLISNQSFEIDTSLASLLCKVWEQRIKKLIETKNFVDETFQTQGKLLKKYQENFKTAQKGDSTNVFYDVFPKNNESTFEVELANFEIVTDEEKAKNGIWDNLKKTLDKWTDKIDREIFQSIEGEIKTALTKDLQSDLLSELKENQKFRESFNSTFQFFATDILKAISKDTNEIRKNTEEIKEVLKPSVDYDSQELKQEVFQYLQRVAEEAVDIKSYFPPHLQNKSFQTSPFDNIRQRVSLTEKKSWDEIRARIEEQNKIRGISTFEEGKTAHKYRLTTGSDIENSQEKRIRILNWDNKASKEFERAIFLGDPGFGKTWLLCFEARKVALDSKNRLEDSEISLKDIILPIKLRLSTLAENASDEILAQSIAKLITARGEIEPFSKNFEAYIYERIKAQENVVILLDALDEVPENPQQGISKEKLRTKLENFANDYPKVSIYLTSRIVGYNNLNIKEAKELEILPFEDEQIKSFTKVWFHKDKAKDEKFHELLENQPQTAGLAQIPLMLSLLCKLFDEQTAEENFPETRGEIYRRCLIGLLRDWKKENERKNINDVELNFRLNFLEKLAFKLFEKQHEQFDETSFTEILCETLGVSTDDFSAEEKVIQWKNRLEQDGIIKKAVKGENPEYLFLHLTFQEYLAGSYIARMPNWKDFVFQDKILFNPRWQEVLTLLGGTLTKEKATNYIESLLEKNGKNGEGDILFRPFMLATFAGKEAVNNLEEEFKQKLIKKIIGRYWAELNLFLNFSTGDLHNWFLPTIKVWRDYLKVILLYHLKFSFLDLKDAEKNYLVVTIREMKYRDYAFIKEFISHIKNPQIDSKIRQEMAWIIHRGKELKSDDGKILWEILEKFKNDEDIQRPISKILSEQKNLSKDQKSYLSEILSKDEGKLEFYEKEFMDKLEYQRSWQIHEKIILELLSDKNQDVHKRTAYASTINHWIELSKETGETIINILMEENHESDVSYYLCEAVHRIKEFSPKGIQKLLQLIENENLYYNSKFSIIGKLAEITLEKKDKIKVLKIARNTFSNENMLSDWEKHFFLEDILLLANQLMCAVPENGEIVIN